jgi:transcriptional regulator with XRE-family HTH domain
MILGERLRALRKQSRLSQADVAKLCGLGRSFVCRVEKGHMVPGIATLEIWARVLAVRPYQLFFFGEHAPDLSSETSRKTEPKGLWGYSGKDAGILKTFQLLLSRMSDKDRQMLLGAARKMASKTK